jgi:prolyl oligopeptidase
VTNLNAPKNKIVQVTLPEGSMLYDNVEAAEQAFDEKNLIEIVAETGNVLETAQVVAQDVVVLRYLVDCKHELFMVHLKDGGMIQKIEFPTIGTVLGITGRPIDENIYFKVYNFVSPGTIYKCDISNTENSKVVQYRETVLEGFDPSLYIVEQRFATSKDGVTQVPMFIVRQKETNTLAEKKGKSCLLYGYGGFNISLTPSFSTFRLSFLEQGGTYVMANIRGGGEYGDDWHNAGTVPNGSKQNVFDDFIACGEWLVENGYTTPEQLCIQGGSNGGLLVAACCNQRPDLFSAGVAQVGVMDMLKFQRYTIGNAWCSDFGNADKNEEDYKKLIKISPIHNVRVPTGQNVQYPSMLLTTGDHDDRVVPLHTLKLLAELQYTIGRESTQTNPLLGRISVNEGHGAGKPTKKIIEEQADIYGFVLEATKVGGGGAKSSSL